MKPAGTADRTLILAIQREVGGLLDGLWVQGTRP